MIKVLAAAFVACFVTLPLQAATVVLQGDSITYEYDDAANAGALALFGTPTIVGDEVRFLPQSFRAESVNGAGDVLVSTNFVFSRIYSQGGENIGGISVLEFGDYRITNGDGVSADLALTISSNINAMDFTGAADSFDATGDSGGRQDWAMQAAANPALAFTGASNDFSMSLQNTLFATSNAPGETAWIQKKLTLVGTVIPVPSAVWLFGAALGLLGWVRARVG